MDKMASLTEEEENFFRIFKLVSGLAPKAVREKFDWYFPPSTLCSVVKQNEPTLRFYYSQKWLNGSQLSLLFPTTGATSSTTYDLTLMICLLRNLTTIQQPVNGYDSLPPSSEISDGADLARVKYYRNQIAHSDKDTLDTQDFSRIWPDLSGAIIRIGGNHYKAKCDDLSQQKLDTDIYVELVRMFQTFKDEVTGEISELKQKTEECGCYDFHNTEINEWVKDHTKFVTTDAVEFVLQMIHEKKRITVTGIPGIGKSALTRHVALHLCTEQGYTIIPCNSPSEIKTHYKEGKLQMFVFDDVCGRYVLNQYDVEEWTKLQKNILGIVTKGNIRIISSCRLQIFKERRFQNIAFLSEHCCDLSSDKFALTKQQRIDIAHQYLPKDTIEEIKDAIQKCEMLPLMCSLFQTKQGITASDFFANPFEIYTKELDQLLCEGSSKIFVLFLLVVSNGCVKKDWFDSESRQLFADMLDRCGNNKWASKTEIFQQFESLVNTYLRKVENDYKAIHDKLFDFLCYYFGQKMQVELINYADRQVIYNRIFLCKRDELDSEFAVFIKEEHEKFYSQRISKDLSDGFICDLLLSNSMKSEKFRRIILNYLTIQNKEDMMKLTKFRPDNRGDTSLQIASSLGYSDIVERMISFTSNINLILTGDFPPLHQACLQGQEKVVRLFIDKGANLNIAGADGWTPLMWACEGRHHTIVNLLVQKGANVNDVIREGRTLLTEWCFWGDYKIVDLLIRSGAKVDLEDNNGETPLTLACVERHYQILDLLISKGADVNKSDTDGWTPLMLACERGDQEVADRLISSGADVNLSDNTGRTALVFACENENFDIAIHLLREKADVKQVLKSVTNEMIINNFFDSLVNNLKCMNINWISEAISIGNTDIVSYLIKTGDSVYPMTDNEKCTLLVNACRGNHEDIVQFLLKVGTDVNKQTGGKSALLTACLDGNYKLVQILVYAGSDVNILNAESETPLMLACSIGNITITQFLIDNGASVNVSDNHGDTALIRAVRYETRCLVAREKYKETLIVTEKFPLIRVLLNNNVCINHQNVIGDSPLIIAMNSHCEELSIFLMDNNADINQKNIKGYTPLMIAVKNKWESVVIALLNTKVKQDEVDITFKWPGLIIVSVTNDEQISINIKDKDINTLLHIALMYNMDDFVFFLLEADAKIESNSKYESSILMRYQQYLDRIILEVLSNKSVNSTTTSYSPNILLKLAVCCRLKKPALILLDDEVDIEQENQDGKTLVMVAVEKWASAVNIKESNLCEDIFKAMLDKGANCNAVDNNGNTVLMIAVYNRCLPAVIMLLNKIRDTEKYNHQETISLINKPNNKGKTPLMLAVELTFRRELYSRGSNLMSTSMCEIPHFLLDRGAEVNAVDNDGTTVLEVAIKSGLHDIAMRMLDKGADIINCNKDGKTPLMLAVEFKTSFESYRNRADFQSFSLSKTSERLIISLLDRGAEINAVDNDGNTVLGLAVKLGFTNKINILLDRGVDINKVNRDGKSPLMVAIDVLHTGTCMVTECLIEVQQTNRKKRINDTLNCLEILKTLLNRGAVVNAADIQNKRVFGLAIQYGVSNSVQMFFERVFGTWPEQLKTDDILALEEETKLNLNKVINMIIERAGATTAKKVKY